MHRENSYPGHKDRVRLPVPWDSTYSNLHSVSGSPSGFTLPVSVAVLEPTVEGDSPLTVGNGTNAKISTLFAARWEA